MKFKSLLLTSIALAFVSCRTAPMRYTAPKHPVERRLMLEQPVNITLLWDYDTNDLSPDLIFKLYHTTNVAINVTNWPVLGALLSTNTPNTPWVTNSTTTFSTVLPVVPGAHFFTMTASNFWGESPYSTQANTPPVARVVNSLGIRRGP